MDEGVHRPVMVEEVVRQLNCRPQCDVLDCTVGAGGHAEAILEATGPDGRLFGIDRDPEILPFARKRLERFGDRVVLYHGRFDQIRECLPQGRRVLGILFDLGVSSLQLSRADRGFSFSLSGPLDMRMDRSSGESAAELLQRVPESELVEILRTYGEERYARSIARAIVRRRRQEPIARTEILADVVRGAVPPAYRHGRIHPATRTFQALRIFVNREIEILEKGLVQAVECLDPGGRICILSFHSLEDRLVKQTFRMLDREKHILRVLQKKPLRPSEDEIMANPRARSAKMRVGERRCVGSS